PMVVFDLRAEATRPFEERGARAADSVGDLARRSDVIVTALPMPRDVEQVAAEIAAAIRPAAIYIDISTGPPSLIRKLAPLFVQKGAHVLDAPVASGQPGAARGIHEVMAGGERAIFERARPVLEAFGDQVIYAGPLGSGCVCKLVHQMINSTISQAIAAAWSDACTCSMRRCRSTSFATIFPPTPFRSSCCARMSAWQRPWPAKRACRCRSRASPSSISSRR